MKRVVTLLFVFAFCAGLAGSARAEEAKAPAKKTAAKPAFKTWAAPDVKFVDTEMKGIRIAVLWGDPKKGAYGALHTWAGGTDVGWHMHTNRVRVVVVSGTFLTGPEGQPPKELGPGSYIEDPGKIRHQSACKAGADCVIFIEQPGKFDFIPDAKK